MWHRNRSSPLLLILVLLFAWAMPSQAQLINRTLQSAVSSDTGVATAMTVAGLSMVSVTVVGSAAADRVVTWKASQDGTNYLAVMCTNPTTLVQATTTTATGVTPIIVDCPVAGKVSFLAAVSGGATGTVTVTASGITGVSVRVPSVSTPGVTLTSPHIATSMIFNSASGNYTLTWADPAAARAISFTDPGGTDSFLWVAAAQETTNKTLTSSVAKGTWTASGTWTLPAFTLGGTVSGGGQQLNNIIIGTSTPLAGTFTTLVGTGGTHTGITSLGLRDTTAAFDVTLAATSTSATLTAGRSLTLDMGNVGHTLALGTTANTLTFPNVASDTVVLLAASQTLTNKTLTSPTLTTPAIGSATGADVSVTGALFGRGFTGQGSVNAVQAEMYVSGGAAVFGGFNRGASTYQPVQINGSTVDLLIAGVSKANIDATGKFTSTSSSLTNISALGIRDTSAAFDVTLAATSTSATLTAGRVLTLDMGNVAHTVQLGTTAGTIIFPNTASDTVAMLGVANTFTAQTINTSTADVNFGQIKILTSSNDAGIGFATTAGGGARNWQIQTNYTALGDFNILRSTTAGGNPTTLALSLNATTAAVTGTLTVSAIASNTGAQTGYLCYNTGAPGTITYDGTNTCLVSLEEYKDNMGPITHAAAIIDKLQPFWGSYKDGTPMTDHHVQPFLGAHQVEGVDRRLVTYSDEGNLKGVRYMNLTAVLVADMQEQHGAIAEMQRRLTSLEHARGRNAHD